MAELSQLIRFIDQGQVTSVRSWLSKASVDVKSLALGANEPFLVPTNTAGEYTRFCNSSGELLYCCVRKHWNDRGFDSEAQVEICRALIEAGAEINTERRNVLANACRRNATKLVELLLSCGADPNVCTADRICLFRTRSAVIARALLDADLDLSHPSYARPVLSHLIDHQCPEVLWTVLTQRYDDIVVDTDTCSRALSYNNLSDNLLIVDLLIAYDVCDFLSPHMLRDDAPAAVDVVKRLIVKGCDINTTDDWRTTSLSPLLIALDAKQWAMAEMLVVAGADVTLRDQANRDAIIHAVSQNAYDQIFKTNAQR